MKVWKEKLVEKTSIEEQILRLEFSRSLDEYIWPKTEFNLKIHIQNFILQFHPKENEKENDQIQNCFPSLGGNLEKKWKQKYEIFQFLIQTSTCFISPLVTMIVDYFLVFKETVCRRAFGFAKCPECPPEILQGGGSPRFVNQFSLVYGKEEKQKRISACLWIQIRPDEWELLALEAETSYLFNNELLRVPGFIFEKGHKIYSPVQYYFPGIFWISICCYENGGYCFPLEVGDFYSLENICRKLCFGK
jgi:hypothetical protein